MRLSRAKKYEPRPEMSELAKKVMQNEIDRRKYYYRNTVQAMNAGRKQAMP